MEANSAIPEVDRYGLTPEFYERIERVEDNTVLTLGEQKKFVHFKNYMLIRLSKLKDNPNVKANVFKLNFKDGTAIKFTLSDLRQVYCRPTEFSMRSIPLTDLPETEFEDIIKKILKLHPYKRLPLIPVD